MRFKQRKELADKYREWVKQKIDNNQTMIFGCVESVIAFLDINGYLNEVVRGEWVEDIAYYDENGCPCIVARCSNCGEAYPTYNYCPNCGADMRERREDGKIH